MPKLFYRAAYEAACRDAPPKQFSKLTDAHFESDPAALEEALGWLTPEQLCDAFYGDWLLQLHHPGGETQLQVRSLLIGKGALAANYLAELAQNADDAFDERDGAETRVDVGPTGFQPAAARLSALTSMKLAAPDGFAPSTSRVRIGRSALSYGAKRSSGRRCPGMVSFTRGVHCWPLPRRNGKRAPARTCTSNFRLRRAACRTLTLRELVD
jgi:hypothetical protein